MAGEKRMSPERKDAGISSLKGFNPDKINFLFGTYPESVEGMKEEIAELKEGGEENYEEIRKLEKKLDDLVFDKAIEKLGKLPRVPRSERSPDVKTMGDVDRENFQNKVNSIKDRVSLHGKKWVVNILLGVTAVFGAIGAEKGFSHVAEQEAAVATRIKEDAARHEAKRFAAESKEDAKSEGMSMAERMTLRAKDVAEIPTEEVNMAGMNIQGSEESIKKGQKHVAKRLLAKFSRMAKELLGGNKEIPFPDDNKNSIEKKIASSDTKDSSDQPEG